MSDFSTKQSEGRDNLLLEAAFLLSGDRIVIKPQVCFGVHIYWPALFSLWLEHCICFSMDYIGTACVCMCMYVSLCVYVHVVLL